MPNGEFEDWVRKGLGRAAVFLKHNDPKPYRNVLLHACTHNLSYDRQCEESRILYLSDLIDASSENVFYRDQVLESLMNPGDDFDLAQLSGLAGVFAARDDRDMRRAMYAVFERLGFSGAGQECAEELVRLDGLAGLLYVTRRFGEVDARDRPWRFRSLLELKELTDHRTLPRELDRFVAEMKEDEDARIARAPLIRAHAMEPRFVETVQSVNAERRLLHIYEHGPCPLCRTEAVRELIAIGRLPAWMREECRFDSESATRDLVRSPTEIG